MPHETTQTTQQMNTKTFLATVIQAAALLFAARSAISQNLLTNGSFELPGVPDGRHLVLGPASTFITGWTTLRAGAEYFVPARYHNFGVAQDGEAALDLAYGAAGGGVTQSFPTIQGELYQVSLWAGVLYAPQDQGGGAATIQVTVGGATTNISFSTKSTFIDWSFHSFSFQATNALTTLSLTTTIPDIVVNALVDNVAVYSLSTNVVVTPQLSIELYPGVRFTGTVGQPYRIDYTTSLPTTNWMPLTYVTLPSSPYLFFDVSSPRSMNRFYRAVLVSAEQ